MIEIPMSKSIVLFIRGVGSFAQHLVAPITAMLWREIALKDSWAKISKWYFLKQFWLSWTARNKAG
jgi:hypothetical protein